MSTIGRIAYRREVGDGSAQRGRSVIYDRVVGITVTIVRVASIHGPRGGSLACNAGVRGLAQLDGYLYVLQVCRGSTDIAVHDTSLKRIATVVRRLTVPGLRDGCDLAACTRHRCLYLADVGSDSVHRLYGLDATLNFQSWPVGDKPWGLSVTSVCYRLV